MPFRQVGHFVAARALGLRTGVPLLLPSLQLGTYGCITPLLSFPKVRPALRTPYPCQASYSGLATRKAKLQTCPGHSPLGSRRAAPSPQTRQDLLDFALAGPAVGATLSLVLYLVRCPPPPPHPQTPNFQT